MQWRELPDLALRTHGGSVVAANDETFAEKENLIRAGEPVFQPRTFGHRGQVMDGWESRRRRTPGDDWVIVRLGVPGLVRGVVVDTSWFTGNYPPESSVEAAYVDPVGPAAELDKNVAWTDVVARSTLSGNTINTFDVDHDQLVTHVRLRIFPDGGVARLRVHGEPVGDPRWVAGRSFDLAAMEHGARVTDASNRFYSSPDNLLIPGPARVMGEGWETARRRDSGNDWAVVDLATEGLPRQIEIDTMCFVGNAPDAARLTAADGTASQVLPRVALQRDAVNRFLAEGDAPLHRLRLDIYPDGGLARFRAFGEPSAAGRAELFTRWYDHLPEHAAVSAMTGWGGADETWARALADARPYRDQHDLAKVSTLSGRPPEPASWAALAGDSG